MTVDNPLGSAEDKLEEAADHLQEAQTIAHYRRAAHAIRDAFRLLQHATSDITKNGYKMAEPFRRTRAAINQCRRALELRAWLDAGFELCDELRSKVLLDRSVSEAAIKTHLVVEDTNQ